MNPTTGAESLAFRIRSGPSRGLTLPIDGPHLKLGRARHPGDRQAGWLKLLDDTVSRLHCELFWQEDRHCFRLLHRSTTNSSYLNGEAVEDGELSVGDILEMGSTTLELLKADLRWSKNADEPSQTSAPAAGGPALGASRVIPGATLSAVSPTPARKITIGPGALFELQDDSGQRYDIHGQLVRLGSPLDPLLDDDQHKRYRFDLEHESDDPTLSPYNLLFRYDELHQRYRLARVGPDSQHVELFRSLEGTVWRTALEEGGEVLLSEGDLIQLGDQALVFSRKDQA